MRDTAVNTSERLICPPAQVPLAQLSYQLDANAEQECRASHDSMFTCEQGLVPVNAAYYQRVGQKGLNPNELLTCRSYALYNYPILIG